jgi:hypothetical protein
MVDTSGEHDIIVTRDYFEALPDAVRKHLRVTRIVDGLEPIIQRHTIEGVVMGEE